MRLLLTTCLALGLSTVSLPVLAQDEGTDQVAQAGTAAEAPVTDRRAIVQRVNAWFNSFKVMSGTFSQIGPDGGQTTGRFWISKPGRMRFLYAPPSPVELIADGRSVAVRDRKLNTQDLYFIGQTPLRFLLADKIDLINDTRILDVRGDAKSASVLLEETSSVAGSARILLNFAPPSYRLTKWTITDAQGYDTTVTLGAVDMRSVPDKKLFYINEQRMR